MFAPVRALFVYICLWKYRKKMLKIPNSRKENTGLLERERDSQIPKYRKRIKTDPAILERKILAEIFWRNATPQKVEKNYGKMGWEKC